MLTLDLEDNDDVGFVHDVMPIIDGVVRVVEPPELYIVKVDNWFGDKWLGFSNKLVGAVGVQYREALRVPPFVPARVVSQRFMTRQTDKAYVDADTSLQLHVEQSSEDNAKRLMSVVCPKAAVIWWSGSTRTNQRGAVMAYLPTPDGHHGWYAELQKVQEWRIVQAIGTTARELMSYASNVDIGS